MLKKYSRGSLLINPFTKIIRVMKNLKITQIKSSIDRSKRQKATIEALGLRKLNNPVIKEATPQILGMVAKVKHLILVEEC